MHTRHPIEPPKDSSTTPYDSANQGRYDGRKQGTEEIHELRKHVVALHLEGLSHRQICEATQLSSTVIRKILALFAKGGMDLLAPKVRGRRFGSCRALTVEQEMRILSLICLGSPRKVGLDFDLWEKNAVIQLVQQQLRRTLSVRSTGSARTWDQGAKPTSARKAASRFRQAPPRATRCVRRRRSSGTKRSS